MNLFSEKDKKIATQVSGQNQDRYNKLPPEYRKEFSTAARVRGAVGFAIIAIGITVLALACSGHLTSFPQDFVHAFTHIDPTKLMIGLGVTIVLIGGTALVIHRARTKEDPYVQSRIFPSDNYDEHIEEAMFEYQKDNNNRPYWGEAYIDKSTLDSQGNGKAYLYGVKDYTNHYTISTIVPLVTPVYTIFSIAYHAIRTVIIPFWVLANYAVEACLGRPVLGKKERYKLVDVILEPWKSLKHVVTDPFYGLAFMAAGIYSLANPMGGRILAAKIERDWNNGATRPEGFWSVEGPQRLWNFGNLDLNFFLAGCWQPIGVVEYLDGNIIRDRGKSMSRAVDETTGNFYIVYSRTELLD
jgi:hypothetical protein